MQIPGVSLDHDGKIIIVSEEQRQGNSEKELVNKEKRKLTLSGTPFSLTCILHKNYILADPTAEEESVMETLVTVVLDSSGQLVSLYKPGGQVLAYTSAIQVSLLCQLHFLMACKTDTYEVSYVVTIAGLSYKVTYCDFPHIHLVLYLGQDHIPSRKLK